MADSSLREMLAESRFDDSEQRNPEAAGFSLFNVPLACYFYSQRDVPGLSKWKGFGLLRDIRKITSVTEVDIADASCTIINMCESHTIYQLCGHVKIKTIVQCADIIENLITSKLQVPCPHQLCADVSDNIHIFPDICDKCQQNGVIGGIMEQQPGMKLEILQSWKKQHNLDAASESRSDVARDSRIAENDSGSEKMEQLETLEVLRVADAASTETSDSGSLVTTSSPATVASSQTACEGTTDLSSIKTRIAALKDRTERLLSRIRVHKTSRESSINE